MSLVSPSQSNPGDEITAARINNPVNQLAAVVNGNIDATNIADGSISNAKVATGIQSNKLANPYKFSVYRTAALNSAAAFTVVAFDTKTFDTGSNVDVVTNKGRFTAPVAGFYFFSGEAGNTAATSTTIGIQLWKNGTVVKNGTYTLDATNVNGTYAHVSGMLQLAANDYVEIAFVGGGGSVMAIGAAACYFDGFLISTT